MSGLESAPSFYDPKEKDIRKKSYMEGSTDVENRSEETGDLFEELADSDVRLAKYIASLSSEEQTVIQSEILNPYGMTEFFFDDEDVDGDAVIEKLNEFFSEGDPDRRKFIAKSIADKLNI